jgi:hypothetical protein
MKKNVIWQFTFCVLLMFITSALSNAHCINHLPQDASSKLERVSFHYVIFKNSLTNPDAPNDGFRNMKVLLDVDAFSEANLKELFRVISKAFPEPERLNLMVYTSVKQVYTPEYTHSNAPTPPEYFYHHMAVYNRGKENEFFRYTLTPTSRELKTVIIRGRDAF